MVTRLFLHAATSGVAGTLPSAEQSSLTADDTFETDTSTNRSMTTLKGASQTTLQNSSIAATTEKIYYIGRWVSDPINQSGIAANTWTGNISSKQETGNAKFPYGSITDQDIWFNIYVWRPSDGTKVGTIADSLITSTNFGGTGNSQFVLITPITGSAVAGAQAGDVIVFEFWDKVTQAAATVYQQNVYFDGTVINTTQRATVSNHASFIETPEDITFTNSWTTTKLYFHATTSGLPSGTLPSAEQSTKTVTTNCNFEGSQTTNRLMNTTIGTSQTSLSLATPADFNANVFYVSRWVSPVIYQTSIDAGTWTYNFAAKENTTILDFPCNGANKAVWVNCYVWKPSAGTKYGTILDGNTAATVTEGTTGQERSQQADFTGAAVSSLTSGDAVIVFEAWFDNTNTGGTSATATFYYDGTTETAGGSTVSNHASLISYSGTAINFTAGGTNFDRPLSTETISISESLAEIYNANRAPTAETISIGESQTRVFTGTRALTAETIAIGESMIRLKAAIRAPTAETVTIGESLVRLYSANRALSDTVIISESLARLQGLVRALTAETTAISESLARIFGVNRMLSDTITIGESLTRVYNTIRSLSDTLAISESLAKVQVLVRSLSDTTAISESLSKVLTLVRNIPAETIVIGESIARAFVGVRTISETVPVSESLTRLKAATRALSDTTVIGESLARVYGAIRSLTDTTAISESLTRIFNTIRSLSDTSSISENLTRSQTVTRTLSTETVILGESINRLLAATRSLSDTTIITGIVDSLYSSGAVGNFVRALAIETVSVSESLVRSISNTRSLLTETTVISESLNRILGAVRSLTDTTIISESLSRLQSLTRTLTDTTTLSESLARVYGAIRNLTNTTVIGESLNRLVALTRSLSDTTVISEILSRIQGLTRTLTDTTAITESLTRVYGVVKSLSDTVPISDSITRLTNMVRSLTQSVIILESLVRTIIREITDYVPSLETDFKDDIDKMVLPYIFNKWNATGQLQKGDNMIDADSPVEFKVGIHSSRPYQILALEQQTEINKISINKFSGGVWQFHTIVEVTVMVQRLQRDIPIELSQMEKEIQRIACHYRRDEIVGIDDLILAGMRREWIGSNKDWSKSIWSTKIYLKAEYQKVNTEAF